MKNKILLTALTIVLYIVLISAELPKVIIPLPSPASMIIINGTAVGNCGLGQAIQNLTGTGLQCIDLTSGVRINIFDQSLNTTNNVIFNYLNLTNNLNMNTNNITNVSYINPFGSTLYLGGTINISGNFYVGGNMSVKRPYGVFTDNTTQTISSTTTAYPMNFSITEDNYYINIINKQNITVKVTGDYMFEVSPLFTCSGGAPNVLDLWWELNGVPIARSNTRITLQTNNMNIVETIPFIIDLYPSDNLRIMWHADSATCSLLYIANQTNPVRPETPSTILTITKISEVQH